MAELGTEGEWKSQQRDGNDGSVAPCLPVTKAPALSRGHLVPERPTDRQVWQVPRCDQGGTGHSRAAWAMMMAGMLWAILPLLLSTVPAVPMPPRPLSYGPCAPQHQQRDDHEGRRAVQATSPCWQGVGLSVRGVHAGCGCRARPADRAWCRYCGWGAAFLATFLAGYVAGPAILLPAGHIDLAVPRPLL